MANSNLALAAATPMLNSSAFFRNFSVVPSTASMNLLMAAAPGINSSAKALAFWASVRLPLFQISIAWADLPGATVTAM